MTARPGQSEAASGEPQAAHVLSFDVEEYFQVEGAAEAGVSTDQWHSFERRLAPSIERILQLLSEHRTTATFFVLGWVAREEPRVLRSIADAGHEIASHGMTHAMVGRLAPEEFRAELLDSRRLLEDISGRPVVGYRAPTFSITHDTAWALDVLAETGYRYDSSVFPVRHDRYGVPDAPRFIHRAIGPGGGEILEVPPATLRLLGANWPVGGGGYLRLLPVRLLVHVLKRAQRSGRPGVIYLHPWELDADQPVLPMSRRSRWRHRVGLSKTQDKLSRLLRNFRFASVAEHLRAQAADVRETFRYGRPE